MDAVASAKRLWTSLLVLPLLSCATTQKGPSLPAELENARYELREAHSEGVQQTFPTTMDKAVKHYRASVDLWQQSQSAKDADHAEQLRIQSYAEAERSKDLAQAARIIALDLKSWDEDIYESSYWKRRFSNGETSNETVSTPVVPSVVTQIPLTAAYFATDQVAVAREDLPQIKKLAGLMTSQPRLQVTLTGFSDPRGRSSYNRRLADKRARAVRAQLERMGIDSRRIRIRPAIVPKRAREPGDEAIYRRVEATLQRNPKAG